ARELDAHAGEFHSRRLLRTGSSIREPWIIRAGCYAIERRFAADRQIAHVENAFLRHLRIRSGRVHRNPHLAAENFWINICEAEEGSGVRGLQIKDIAAAGAAA